VKSCSQGIRGKRVGEAKTAPMPPVLPLLPVTLTLRKSLTFFDKWRQEAARKLIHLGNPG